ncbi:golgin candidate 5 [Cucumis melo var. makuwa]|uniref:Golgin candidate 5 n=1 Tax=Cucumis melo var. makuwa TaxID=1194695 RepID=A0A5A7UR71_CUCMM|nr:golgin candidate 5 [Cucumis melo var. makuwa]TYK20989.1 golgin candidate 5 [Cucumis melo var. makuwa]
MDFDSVYKSLKELFPEVDHRILRAVALENPKDVHLAVNDILTEVIPRCHPEFKSPLQDHCVEFASKIEEESGTVGDEACNGTSYESGVAHLDGTLNQSVSVNSYVASDDCERHENTETTSLSVPANIQEDRSEVEMNRVAPEKSNGLIQEDSGHNDHEQSPQITKTWNQVTEDIKQNKTLLDGVHHSLNVRDLDSLLVQELLHDDRPIPVDENSDSQTANPSFENHSESDYKKSNANGTSNPEPKQESSTGEMTTIEDRLMGPSILTRSGQPCSIDHLDEIIENAKSNKITLFSAMQSVTNKMKELEDMEKYFEKVKEDTANSESEILAKVEEMKQTVARTKEANDMHAGEVYGEKAILATETRELQSRLLSLSDERDSSLSILDEMHTTLKSRMASLEATLKALEEEKLAKEEHARKALAEQEALTEKVVQESKILQHEANENAKLREFLIERGQLVDVLQGEISVICQDVRHLKEKFDLEVPLSKSLSSSQTSFILASSGSSLKTATSDLTHFSSILMDTVAHLDAEKGTSLNLGKEGNQASSVSSSSLSSNNLKEEGSERNHFKSSFSDDGWDVFDKDAEFSEASYFVDAKESLKEF